MTGVITNDLLDTERIENLIRTGFAIGVGLLLAHGLFGKAARSHGGGFQRVAVELQRKSFHMIGGSIICSIYHFGIKGGYLSPAFDDGTAKDVSGDRPLDGGLVFLSGCFVTWLIEASRLLVPSVQKWYMSSFKGLIREKEVKKAAGIAYFLPGALAAMACAPENLALLGILNLSIGDAASSIGTAAGSIPVGSSSRKVEGSIACMAVCTALGYYAGLSLGVAVRASALVTVGELLAEVIGLDDNFVLPLLTVFGVRLALCPKVLSLLGAMGCCLGVGIILGMAVGSTTPKEALGTSTPQVEAKKA